MRYSIIQNYFDKGEVGVEELLKDCDEVFDAIEEYKEQFMANIPSTEDEYKEILNKLTGYYLFLEPIFTIAQAYKEIKEDTAYCNLRTEAEVSGKKLTADALKVEAHKAVSLWIRIRNIFESYVNGVEKSIVTCQTQLKRLEETRKYKPSEEK